MPAVLPTATEALRLFRAGEFTPGQLLRQTLQAVDAQVALGAFVSVDREAAARQAAAADAAWARAGAGECPAETLCGLPLTVKDIIDVAGTVTGCGNPRRGAVAQQDATVVRLLREAGAVLLGKVQLHEYALGITGDNPRMGTPRNPHDPTRLPGGSSSGSAVSVAAGMALASIGTDTGGSVRVPAALCGVVGFKPTFGRISRHGVFPLSCSMDHVGLLAREVADVALLFDVLDRQDPLDPVSLGLPRAARSAGRSHDTCRPPRVGLLEQLHSMAAPQVSQAVEWALSRMERAGVVGCEPVSLPMHDEVGEIYRTILLAEAAEVHRGALSRAEDTHFGDDVRRMLEEGAALPASRYAAAQRAQSAFAAACDGLLGHLDGLVSPTTLAVAPAVGAREVEIGCGRVPVRSALVSCTSPFSMIGLPALSLPCGEAGGMPLGLQLVGRRHDDQALLQLARQVEQALLADDRSAA